MGLQLGRGESRNTRMTEASIGKDVARARVMLTNLLGVVTLRPKKGGRESRAARKCAHPTGGEQPILLQLVPGGGFCLRDTHRYV